MIPPKRNPNIKHINPEVPKFEIPKPKGERYPATVPDTLDLAERAALAVNALTGAADPKRDRYKADRAPMKTVERYVAPRVV